MIHARRDQAIGEVRFRALALGRCFDRNRQSGLRFEGSIIIGNLEKAAGLSRDQEDYGKFAAENSHLAIFDVAAVPRDEFRKLFDQTNLIGSHCRQNKMIFFSHRYSSFDHVKKKPFTIASCQSFATGVAIPCGSSDSVYDHVCTPAPIETQRTLGAGFNFAKSDSDLSQRAKVTVSSLMPWSERKGGTGLTPGP